MQSLVLCKVWYYAKSQYAKPLWKSIFRERATYGYLPCFDNRNGSICFQWPKIMSCKLIFNKNIMKYYIFCSAVRENKRSRTTTINSAIETGHIDCRRVSQKFGGTLIFGIWNNWKLMMLEQSRLFAWLIDWLFEWLGIWLTYWLPFCMLKLITCNDFFSVLNLSCWTI